MDKFDKICYRLWALLLPIGIFLHAIWGTFFYFIMFIGRDKRAIEALLPSCPKCADTLDAISYAQQVGRLDIISLILAGFGIIIAIAAVGWFGYIRSEAKQEARDEVRECAVKIISDWIENNPDVITRAIQDSSITKEQLKIISDGIKADVANEIAEAFSGLKEER